MTSYPDPTPVSVVDDAVSFASSFGCHITAIACEAHVQVSGSFLGGSFVGGIAAGEAHRSLKNAQALLAAFESSAEKAGIPHQTVLERCLTHQVPARFVEYARLRDLTITSVPESYDQWYSETIIFESGKPTLVLPESPRAKPFDPKTVVVAWDFSRAAARAVADAIPLLEKADPSLALRSMVKRSLQPGAGTRVAGLNNSRCDSRNGCYGISERPFIALDNLCESFS